MKGKSMCDATTACKRRFEDETDNDSMDTGVLRREGRSSDFVTMMTRLFAIRSQGAPLRIGRFRPEHELSFMEWIYSSLSESCNRERQYFYVVSGDFSPRHWNNTRHFSFKSLICRPDLFPRFEMRGLTSSYVAMSSKNVDIDSPTTVHIDGKLYGNNLFSIFYKAYLRKDDRFLLLRSDRMPSCHWLACGGRMVVGDLHPACLRKRCCCHMHVGALVEGPPEVIREIAQAEFNNSAAAEADSAILFNRVLDRMPSAARKKYLNNNSLVPNHGFNLKGLHPTRRDLEPVVHFGATLYRAGNFLLGTCKNIQKAIDNESRFERDFLNNGEETMTYRQQS